MIELPHFVYKILTAEQWRRMQMWGQFSGSPDDLRDGFIHLSEIGQVNGTLEKHFPGRTDLVILEIDASDLGKSLKWEPSRGGQLFPHQYGSLSTNKVRRAVPIAEWTEC